MKQKSSKLDAVADRLTDWFMAGKTLAEAREQLRLDGISVSLSRLSDWWQARQASLQEAQLLRQIATGARQCQELEREFHRNPAPELETIIRLQRVLVMKLSTQGAASPELLDLVARMMRPVMDYAKLEAKRRELDLNETKYRDQVAERKAAMERELAAARTSGGITPETLEKIEAELKLL